MLPIGGRFRVIDFTIRNSISSHADNTIIFNSHEDPLQQYIDNYTSEFSETKSHKIMVYPYNSSDIESILDSLIHVETSFFVIYNGDNPSIINFSGVFEKFKESKKKSLLIKLRIDGKPSMAYKVVICEKKKIISLVKKVMKDKNKPLNFFEMIINTLIHSGINTTILDAYYWPINSLTDYYLLNREIIWNREISDALANEKIIQSKIKTDRFTLLGEMCSVKNSCISDHCYINGKVENSIIFPCVDIEEGAVVTDSIILPFVRIGQGARVRNSIIDESTDANTIQLNVGRNCIIGSGEKYMKNSDFPHLLNSGITLIGKNNYIKDGITVGSACYIASSSSEEYFSIRSKLDDGESIIGNESEDDDKTSP
jgi:ADP-glucose pyrophosphorylase